MEMASVSARFVSSRTAVAPATRASFSSASRRRLPSPSPRDSFAIHIRLNSAGCFPLNLTAPPRENAGVGVQAFRRIEARIEALVQLSKILRQTPSRRRRPRVLDNEPDHRRL